MEASLLETITRAESDEKTAFSKLGPNPNASQLQEYAMASQEAQRKMTLASTILKNMHENLMALIRNLKLN